MIALFASLSIIAGSVNVPAVQLQDLEDRFANGGDTVYVVNFWATWCKPCIEELPAFDKFHRSVQGKPIKVLLVSLDDPKELKSKVEVFVRKKGLRPEVVLLDEAKPHEWIDKVDESWSGAIPATLLIDASSGRRLFLEQDFTFDELSETVGAFSNVSSESKK